MSYQGIIETRAKRAEKDAAKEKEKGKCGRKRKNTASEQQAKKTRVSEVLDLQRPWSVSVAKMY